MPLSLPMTKTFPKGTPYILALPKWYPNKVDKSDGNFIEKHIECISSKRKVVVLFTKGIQKSIQKELKIELNEKSSELLEIRIYYPLVSGILSGIINVFKYIKYSNDAFKIIEKEIGTPDICHLHVMGRNGVLAYILQRSRKIPFIVSEHWSAYFKESNKLGYWKRIAYRLIFQKSSEVTTVSEALGKAMKEQQVIETFNVIPNVVDELFFNAEFQQTHHEIKRLVHISNLIPEIKQTDKMLKLLNQMAEKRRDFEVYIIGDGKARRELEVFSDKLSFLKGRVHFTGDIEQKEIVEILKSASASMLFSKFETQSIVLLESLAMGIPVVAPYVGGIPEHCENRGYLFQVNSGSDFKQCVENALDQETDFNRTEMREYCQRNFSCPQVAGKFEDIYTKVLKRPNAK